MANTCTAGQVAKNHVPAGQTRYQNLAQRRQQFLTCLPALAILRGRWLRNLKCENSAMSSRRGQKVSLSKPPAPPFHNRFFTNITVAFLPRMVHSIGGRDAPALKSSW